MPLADPASYPIRITGVPAPESAILLGAVIREGIDQISAIEAELVSPDRKLDPEDLLGTAVAIEMEMHDGPARRFAGRVVSIEFIGDANAMDHYVVEIRPWAWFLTRRSNCKVFQHMSTLDIVKEILGEHGRSGQLTSNIQSDLPSREFCLQYREDDLTFIRRLLEEDGVYFWFDSEGGEEKMVLGDGPGSHGPMDDPTVPYHHGEGSLAVDHLSEWRLRRQARTGKITLTDYNFEKPNADLTGMVSMPQGSFSENALESYDYPARAREADGVKRQARIRMEGHAARYRQASGSGNIRRLRVGQKFTLQDHPTASENREWLVTTLVHRMILNSEDHVGLTPLGSSDGLPAGLTYEVSLEALFPEVQFRPMPVTLPPRIAGVQTATVVGGGEIHTEVHGRVKIRFHWDRIGADDGSSSCWVRVATPWSGASWGFAAVPRVGQEVVVAFEDGDPDRPIIVGMLYKDGKMPPWTWPGDKTQLGIRTNSSEGGGGFHELVFEDKKGSEFVRMQSEKNYLQMIKNNARRDVGNDLVQSVGANKTQFVKISDTQMTGVLKDTSVGLIFDEKIGGVMSQIVGIFKEEKVGFGKKDFGNAKDALRLASATVGPASTVSDELFDTKFGSLGTGLTYANAALAAVGEAGKNEEIHGLSRLEVNGDREQLIKKGFSVTRGAKPGDFKTTVVDGEVVLNIQTGPYHIDIDKGEMRTNLLEGNKTTFVKKGDYSIKAEAGKIVIEAEKSIELKVGSTTLVLDQKSLKAAHKASSLNLDKDNAELWHSMAALMAYDNCKIHVQGVNTVVEGGGTLELVGELTDVDGKLIQITGQIVRIG